MQPEECYEFGYVLRPHGYRGDLLLQLDVDDAEAYEELDSFFILVKGTLVPYFVEEIRFQGNKVIVKLEDVDSFEVAQSLVGNALYLPLDNLPELEEGQFYYHDIIGYRVVDEAQGPLGTVETVYEMPQQDLIAMRYQGKEVLIPVTDDIVTKAVHASKELLVHLPDGLLELYLNNAVQDDGEDE